MSSIRLGEIGKISMCKRILKSQTNEFSGIPFYKISTFGGTPTVYIDEKVYLEYKEKYSYPKKGDILISAAGTIGKTVIFDGEDSYFQDSNIVWIENDESKVTNQFLYYFLQTNPFITTNGSTIKRLYNDNLRDTKIPNVPSIQQQNQITDILGTLDKKIQTNNQINQELEAMAKTLYDYWFVQFDFPDQNGKPYKSSGGKMVYNPELKREIPEGWGVTTFSNWISDNKTGDWGKDTSEGNYKLKVDCIRGADINSLSGNGKIDMPTRFILEKNKNKLLTDFDIVIEISGGSPTQSTGRIVGISENVLNRFELPLICSNFCKAVSLNEQETFYNFVYEWKNLYDNGVLFSWEGKTSGIKNLLFDSFVTNYHIAQPPIDLMKQFFDYASSVDKKTQLLLKQNQELTKLRDWLLPMLMNGQVKVER
ncbi:MULTISPECIES: restriction endonuclease subunit S [Streptococcus]|jgi:putative type I restriction enzyme specificity protein HI_0216|uniref:restriction endonuclease subunit S n=1 Tax=Streptococcus TaxID=1301 RepID=UPI00066B7B5A|nr:MULTISPECIES: restriction endonuclease subunit S [Streptococcus]OFQ67194.1 restriction endonuclease subunit S [Streptococcus sp. HMSC078D09]